MPWLGLKTSVEVPEEKRGELLSLLSGLVADDMGKPQQYVMVSLEHAAMMLGGAEDSAAFVDVRGIGGFGPSVNNALTKHVCATLQDQLGIPAHRTYVTFTDVAAGNWGWNGRTFG
jgi:phenylpyruvate tautomerase PptA (4-oxalocrotonate tautomerase family)